jgi:chemotaxis methyl-accepting protein methylase
MTDSEAGFRWQTEGTEAANTVTLDSIRAFVDSVSGDLDPGSRYVTELRAVLDASSDVSDYLARLQDKARLGSFQKDGAQPSQGERGRSWVDDETWGHMNPFEQTLSNLLTGETRMMWAGEGATNFSKLGEVLGAHRSGDEPVPVLSVPSSTGKETFSIAIAALQAGVPVRVTGVDRQEAYLARARSGTLVTHHRDLQLDGVEAFLLDGDAGRTRVAESVRELCSFEHGDVLTGKLPPQGSFALVSCRNLLGYFREKTLETAWRNVAARIRPGGTLLVDPFVSGSKDMALVRTLMSDAGFTRRFPDANYYDAPAAWGTVAGA